MSIAGDEMDMKERKDLLDEHVRLTAQFNDGNTAAAIRLDEIERQLRMNALEIMQEAISKYQQEY